MAPNATDLDGLREAVQAFVDQTSLRRAADDIGVSHTGLHYFLAGRTAPQGRTLLKLRLWHARHLPEEEIDLDLAKRIIRLLLPGIPDAWRDEMVDELVAGLSRAYGAHGVAIPRWMTALLEERRKSAEAGSDGEAGPPGPAGEGGRPARRHRGGSGSLAEGL